MSIPIDLDPIKRGLQMMSEVKAAHGSQSMRECINPDKVMESIALLIAEVERLRAEQRLDLADVDRFRAMARGYMDERDDARLALAMARGEGWPEGWSWKEGHLWWESPCGLYYITPVAMCRNLKRGGWKLDWHRDRDAAHDPHRSAESSRVILHPDALSALRAYQAKVTS